MWSGKEFILDSPSFGSLPGKNKLRGIITYGARAVLLEWHAWFCSRKPASYESPSFSTCTGTGTDFADRLRAQRTGAGPQALWERVEAGSGSLGAASSESAAGSGRLSGPAAMLSRPRLRSSR